MPTLLENLTNPDTSVATLAEIGQNAHFGDSISMWGNKAFYGPSYLQCVPSADNNAGVADPNGDLNMYGDFEIRLHFTPVNTAESYKGFLSYSRGAQYAVAAIGNVIYLFMANTNYSMGSVIWDVEVHWSFRYNVTAETLELWVSADGENWSLGQSRTGITPLTSPNNKPFYVGCVDNIWFSDSQIYSAQVFASLDESDKRLDLDFSTFTRNATSGKALTGQDVSINQSGNPYAMITAEQATSGAVQETENAQPIYYPKGSDGSYMMFSGTNYNYFKVADSPEIRPTGDIEIIIHLKETDWTPSALQTLFCGGVGNTGTNRNYYVVLNPSGSITFTRSSDTAQRFYGVGVPTVADGQAIWLKFTWQQSDGNGNSIATMYQSSDGEDWDYVGEQTRDGDEPASADDWGLSLGARNTTTPMIGGIMRFILKNGIDGQTVLDVNVQNDAQHGDTAFQATTGQDVTRETNGVNPCKIIAHSLIRFEGIDDFMEFTFNEVADELHCFFIFQSTASNNSQRPFSVDSDALTNPQIDQFAEGWRVGGNSGYHGDISLRSLLEVKWNNNNECRLAINGVQEYNDGNVPFSELKFFLAGAISGTFPHAAIDFEALYVYKGSYSDDDALQITKQLNDKYNVY